jgi:hypothetical protein
VFLDAKYDFLSGCKAVEVFVVDLDLVEVKSCTYSGAGAYATFVVGSIAVRSISNADI